VSIDAPDTAYSVTLHRGKSRFGSGFLYGIDWPVSLAKPPA
jgi:hypothetical protein